MKPVVDRLKQRFDGTVAVTVVNLSAGNPADEQLAQRFGIQYVPTFVFVDSQGVQQGDMIVGGASEEDLAGRLDALK